VEVGDGPGGAGEADADGGFLEGVGGDLVRVAANPAAGKDALDLACIAIIRDMAGVPEGPIVAAVATGPVAGRERALRDAIDAVESLRDGMTCGYGDGRPCDGCLARAEDIAAIRPLPGRPGERPSERVVAEQVHVRREAARVDAVVESAGRELHSDAIEVEVVLGGNHPRQ
jgi:hypothetical protein